jgi:AsmA protein
VIAVALFFVFFPKQLAAQEAERRIEEATHRQVHIGDDIQVTFWPAIGFSVNDVSLSNPEGFPANEPFIAAQRVVFAVAVLPLLRGDVQVRRLIFDHASVNLRAKSGGEANWTFPTENTAPQQQTTIEDLRLDDVRLIDSGISFQGADASPPLQLEHVSASLALQSLDTPATLNATLTYRGEQMTISGAIDKPRAVLENGQTPLHAHVRGAPLEANFDGTFNAQSGALEGHVGANGASLRRLLAWTGTPMAQGGGFGAFRVDAAMTHQDTSTALTHATLALDAIRATGNLTLNSPPNGRLSVTGALAAPSIDANTYLPPPAQGAPAGGGVNTNSGWSAERLDLSGLRALDANLDLSVGELKFQRMTFTNVALNLRLAHGAADARLTRISLYGGGGTARLIADGSGATPRIAAELNTQNIEAEPLLRDAIGFDKITGRGRLTASIVGQGVSQAALMHSLRGNASFAFNDGQIKGVNLAAIARSVQSALSGQAAGPAAATDFAELGATFQIANGVAATQDLHMLNPFVRMDGQGLINIGDQSIDMRLAPRVVSSARGQGGNASAGGLGIPFRIHGPWSHVGFEPALAGTEHFGAEPIGRQPAGLPKRAVRRAAVRHNNRACAIGAAAINTIRRRGQQFATAAAATIQQSADRLAKPRNAGAPSQQQRSKHAVDALVELLPRGVEDGEFVAVEIAKIGELAERAARPRLAFA